MRVRNFAVSLTAAAVMGAFGPAFAQTVNVDPNVGVDANVGISNTDVNAGAIAVHDQSRQAVGFAMHQALGFAGFPPEQGAAHPDR